MICPFQFYEYRIKIRELYRKESMDTDDLVSKILEIRDNNTDKIESITVSLENYSISVQFSNQADIDNIASAIINIIGNFINSHICELKVEKELDKFREFIDKKLFVDFIKTNSSVEFNL